jgi:hypothetical protein
MIRGSRAAREGRIRCLFSSGSVMIKDIIMREKLDKLSWVARLWTAVFDSGQEL